MWVSAERATPPGKGAAKQKSLSTFGALVTELIWFADRWRCSETLTTLFYLLWLLCELLVYYVFHGNVNYLFFLVNLWIKVAEVEACLSQTILALDGDHPNLFSVNFNPRVISLFQEVHCAFQTGIRLPNVSVLIFQRKTLLLRMKDEAQVRQTTCLRAINNHSRTIWS